MMFAERRLAVALSVFMLTVFFLRVFEYKFMTAALIVSGLLTVVFAVLFIVLKKSGKHDLKSFRTFCGFALFFIAAAFAAVFFCALHFNIYQKPVENYLDKYKDTPVYIKAEITDISSNNFAAAFDLRVFELDGKKTPDFNLRLSIEGEVGASPDEIGDILETRVIFKDLEESLTYGMSPAYYRSGGYYIAAVHVRGTATDLADDDNDEEIAANYKIYPPDSRSLNYYLEQARRYTEKIFFKNIKINYRENITPEAATAFGIFTGVTDEIPQSVKNDFRKSGIYHALSVSGLHLAILCGIIFYFMNLFKVHKKIICVAVILCCLIFMAFTGFSLPVIRSGIMMILFYAAFLIGRKSDPFTSLLFAGTFIVLMNPHNILNTGFQLSLFATLGIISTNGLNNKIMMKLDGIKRFKIFMKILKIFISSFVVTLSSTVFTLPFVSYSFKALSLFISPVANLVTSPLITAVMFLSLCIMIFSFIPGILPVFCVPVYYITKLLIYITEYLASFKYSYISVESTNGTGFYIFSAILLVLVILCFLLPPFFAGSKLRKYIKPVLFSSVILTLLIMAGSLIYPRIIYKDSVKFAYYSDEKNQNVIIFNKDYDYADIIDMTHGTLSHTKPVYDIINENGAMYINSVTLTDYRKRHVNMIRRYLTFSDINKVYVPEPQSKADIETFNLLYYLSIDEDFELINYGNSVKLGDVLITVNTFDYNKMPHMMVDIEYKNATVRRRLLYLGIGYKDGYEKFTDIKNQEYDIIFYGSHKHKNKDEGIYSTDISGSYAGVLSSYLDGDKNRQTQKLEISALEAYVSGSVLFLSDNYASIIFEIRKDGGIRRYFK